jgi:hypothetical protein
MKGKIALFALVLAFLSISSLLALAQEGITVTSNTYEYSFSEELVFRLEARSGSEINDITLFYRVEGEEATIWGRPDFTPGKEVVAEYVKRLQRGEIAPFSEIEYFWRIRDTAGGEIKTEPIVFVYEDERFEWMSSTQGKVTLYWYDADIAFGEELLEIVVKALTRLEREVGIELEDSIKVVVYQNASDMREALIWKGDIFESQVVTLGTVASPRIMVLDGTHVGVERTIAHELTHMVVDLLTKNPYVDLPAWLKEGLAMYNEGELRRSMARTLARAIRDNRLISIKSLTAVPGEPDKIELFYGEAYSIVAFLLEGYGKKKMAELLALFKEGTLTDDALKQVYGFDQDGLEDLWREHIGAPPRRIPTPTPEVVEVATPEVEPTPSIERKPCMSCCGAPLMALMIALVILKLINPLKV